MGISKLPIDEIIEKYNTSEISELDIKVAIIELEKDIPKDKVKIVKLREVLSTKKQNKFTNMLKEFKSKSNDNKKIEKNKGFIR
jgi:RNA polymerase-interacting CarD/CdnL/TRCF family regulator